MADYERIKTELEAAKLPIEPERLEEFSVPGVLTEGLSSRDLQGLLQAVSKEVLRRRHPDSGTDGLFGRVDPRDIAHSTAILSRLDEAEMGEVATYLNSREDQRIQAMRSELGQAEQEKREALSLLTEATTIEKAAQYEYGEDHASRFSGTMYRRRNATSLDLQVMYFEEGKYAQTTSTIMRAKKRGILEGSAYEQLSEEAGSNFIARKDDGWYELTDGNWQKIADREEDDDENISHIVLSVARVSEGELKPVYICYDTPRSAHIEHNSQLLLLGSLSDKELGEMYPQDFHAIERRALDTRVESEARLRQITTSAEGYYRLLRKGAINFSLPNMCKEEVKQNIPIFFAPDRGNFVIHEEGFKFIERNGKN